jgi:hypothetical protein
MRHPRTSGDDVTHARPSAKRRPGAGVDASADGALAAHGAADPTAGRGALEPHEAGLHEVIQILFDWDGDHLDKFLIGRRSYADPGYLDACKDDEAPYRRGCGGAGPCRNLPPTL